ncbi:MAG: lysophospholipid acyltransferase family protein [Thermoleophilaceae bacterium]
MKAQVYKDPRPAEHFDRFHARVRRGRPDLMYEVVRLVLTPILLLFYRTRAIDTDKVPSHGPAIVAPNHFSFIDHFFIAVYLRRKVQFMAKSQLFKAPIQFVYSHGGVFPILRGRRDEEAFQTAHAVLARGGIVVMYAEGGRSRTGKLGEPKPGIGRLAIESGAPVVPAAIAGSAKVRDWRKLQFPKVTVQYDDPFRFERAESPTREQSQAAAQMIFDRISALYGGLDQSGRRGAVRAARAARRRATDAAEAVGRRPAAH